MPDSLKQAMELLERIHRLRVVSTLLVAVGWLILLGTAIIALPPAWASAASGALVLLAAYACWWCANWAESFLFDNPTESSDG